jgi:ketosteroid isomerase-like protein
MSNLDLVRSILETWERGDFSHAEWAHPKIEFVLADGPDPHRSQGVDAMAEGWREFLSAWAGYCVQADEYRDLADDRVLVLLRAAGGHGKDSGLELGLTSGEQGANVFHMANGKVMRLVVYFDRDRALADLGLTPKDDSADRAEHGRSAPIGNSGTAASEHCAPRRRDTGSPTG